MEKTNKKREYNIGLGVLRSVMCFMVVLCHFWDATSVSGICKLFSFSRGYAVSVFMLISFILACELLIKHEKDRIIKRFERLFIPQIGWAIIYWIVFWGIDLMFDSNFGSSISDMLWQIFTGHSPKLNPTMWFQVDLILLTLLFLSIIIYFEKSYYWVFLIMGIIAIILQYSGAYMLFSDLRYELKYPIGRMIEMLPVAVVGFFIGTKEILEKLKEYRFLVFVSSICLIGLIGVFPVSRAMSGYGYAGVDKIIISLSFVAIFYIIPFEKLSNNLQRWLKKATQYTVGIYCMHRLIGVLLNGILIRFEIDIININSFIECIVIYIISFLCSFVGLKIIGKTKLKALLD